MAKKELNKDIKEIKELAKKGKFLIGFSSILKSLEKDGIKKIYVASNSEPGRESELRNLAEFNNIEINKIELGNKEIGRVFRKAYGISFFALLKE